eukprot:544921-Hanusia_phi.AAC.5
MGGSDEVWAQVQLGAAGVRTNRQQAQRTLEELGRGAKRSTPKGKKLKRAVRIFNRLKLERNELEKKTGR